MLGWILVGMLLMADAGLPDTFYSGLNFLGKPTNVSLTGEQPGGPSSVLAAAGAAPSVPAAAPTTGGTGGSTAITGGRGPSNVLVQEILTGLRGGVNVARLISQLTGDSGTGRSEGAFQSQRAGERDITPGQSNLDLFGAGPTAAGAGAPSTTPGFNVVGSPEEGFLQVPGAGSITGAAAPAAGPEAVTAQGAFAGEVGGVTGASAGGEAAVAGTEAASPALSAAGAYAPYLAAVIALLNTGQGIASRTNLPQDEQALLAATQLLSGGNLVPGFSEGAMGIVESIYRPSVPHAVREGRDESNIANQLTGTFFPQLGAATTPEQIADAFGSYIQAQQGIIGNMAYPTLGGKPLSREAIIEAVNSGDPNKLDFALQAGVDRGWLGQANTALNTAVRQQVALQVAARNGDPQAMAILNNAVQQRAQQQASEAERQRQFYNTVPTGADQGGGDSGGVGAP